MNPMRFAILSIRARRMPSALCVLAAGAGIGILSLVLLLSHAVTDSFARNAAGIDIVAGAKGSPLQLVLSTVYHADVPVGNIETADAGRIAHLPQVAKAVPLALGDNYRGWRIVGTTPDYLDMTGARIGDGRVFAAPFEAVAGAATGLRIGDTFAGAHGFSADSDDIHDWHLYKIVGRLAPAGAAVDRLILTSVQSVQELHMHGDEHEHEHHHHHDHDDGAEDDEAAASHQVTALLIKMKNRASIPFLPRQLARDPAVQAASPAYEIARLARVVGAGRGVATAAGGAFLLLACLMLWSALAASLAARRYDLCVMRVLGASPAYLFAAIMAESALLAGTGTLAGLALGHAGAFFVARHMAAVGALVAPETLLQWTRTDALLMALGMGAGLAAALVPACAAARTDIAGLLAKGR